MSKKNNKLGDETFIDVVSEKIDNSNKKKKGCGSCKQKGLKPNQWFMVIFGFYILFSSIYGTIKLIRLFF